MTDGQTPPPLPARPRSASTNNMYTASRKRAPSNPSTPPFREPELVPNDDDDIKNPPPFTFADILHDSDADPNPKTWSIPNPDASNGWASTTHDATWNASSQDWDWSAWGNVIPGNIPISGRDLQEEDRWWLKADVDAADGGKGWKMVRPGPGLLPTALVEGVHDAEHTLFEVEAERPEVKTQAQAQAAHARSASASSSTAPSASAAAAEPPTSTSTSAPSVASSSNPPPVDNDGLHPSAPTQSEIDSAIPRASFGGNTTQALYCRKHHSWVLLLTRTGPLPTLHDDLKKTGAVLPDEWRKGARDSCVEDGSDAAHHYHVYERAVDAREVGYTPSSSPSPSTSTDDEPLLLDLAICCQCSTHVLYSQPIPGIVPSTLLDSLTREKRENPVAGRTAETGVLVAVETVVSVIQNRLFRGETRGLPVTRPAFQRKLGWTPTVQEIFSALDFRVDADANGALLLPPADDRDPAVRARLIRAWVELGAWAADWAARFPAETREHRQVNSAHRTPVVVKSAREKVQRAIGAHPEQIRRTDPPSDPAALAALAHLGLTPTTCTSQAVLFAYYAQARCDPSNTPLHFGALVSLLDTLPTDDIQGAIVGERARGRFTPEDVMRAGSVLGFGRDGPLALELDEDVDDVFVERAFRDVLRRRARGSGSDAAAREAADALRIIGAARGSEVLVGIAQHGGMTLERAFTILGVGADADGSAVDDGLLITVYGVNVDDQPAQAEKLREALGVVAEYRDSARLRRFLETGEDPGDISVAQPPKKGWPRGLNQLGNTCYLNSLLQYLYTVRDLRQAIAPLGSKAKGMSDDAAGNEEGSSKGKDVDGGAAGKGVEGKVTEEELRRRRVGGRMVSRREIARSKRFVGQLAHLFFQMQCADNAAVTPTIELAKLALVSHRDEEEEEEEDRVGATNGGTGAGTDSDATLVDDGPSVIDSGLAVADGDTPPRVLRVESPPPSLSPPPSSSSASSVLGKRVREEPMQIDARKEEEEGMEVDKPASAAPPLPPRRSTEGASRKSTEVTARKESVSTVRKDNEVAAPARKESEGGMMFGRQHDLTECMDNCIFQIETALLRFGDSALADAEDDKTSLVKRLFYGKRKQWVVPSAEPSGRAPTVHEREDPFFQLPINVSDEGCDLYDALAGYFADAAVELDRRPARMESAITELPPILQIQLQRAQFDRETLMSYKSQAYVRFEETIRMDRFLDGVGGTEKRAKSKKLEVELAACRERISLLTMGKHAPYDAAIASTAEFLQKVDGLDLPEADDALVAQLTAEQDLLAVELAELRSRAVELKTELEALWENERAEEYELTSVFIHRGSSPSFGHYFFYSRHLPEKPDEWFKYNDSEVSTVPKEEVFADTTGQTANPYMLVYVRKGADLIDTVDRIDDDSFGA